MKRKLILFVSIILTVFIFCSCGSKNEGNVPQTQDAAGETETVVSAEETQAGTEPQTAAQKEVNIIPAESVSVQYETYADENGYFTVEIPKGWSVKVGMPPNYDIDLISYAVTVFDPQNTDRRLYLNLLGTGMLKSEEARNWYNKMYPGTFGDLPAVTEQTTEGFFNAYGEYYGYKEFSVTENLGPTEMQGDLLNATAVSSETGKPLQGLFTAAVMADSYPVQKDMFDASQGMVDVGMVTAYTIMYEMAPQQEFLDWQPVLDHCLSTLTFTDNFQTQRQGQWKAVLGAASYVFRTADEISDMIMSSWENRNKSYDVISQKQSDATLGYDRVLDTETGEYYRADAGFGDVFDSDRYIVVDDDAAYLTPSSGWIEWK